PISAAVACERKNKCSVRTINVRFRTALRIMRVSSQAQIRESKVHGAGREKIFDLALFRRQTLLMRVFDDSLKHRAILLDAVGKRICAKDISCFREVFFSENESRWDAIGKIFLS